jgi:quinol monooxygenase YgiN
MYILMMQLKVQENRIDDFIVAATEDARNSVESEPGCRQFDVVQDTNDSTSFAFYQVFDDEAAFLAHTQTAHFKSAHPVIDELIDGPKSVTFCRSIFSAG